MAPEKKGPEKAHRRVSPSSHLLPLRSREFRKIFQAGNRWAGEHLALWVLKGEAPREATAWGIVVSREAARRAVERNRWKRRIRELLRGEEGSILPGYRGVVQVRKSAEPPGHQEIKKEIRALLRKAGVL